MSGTTNSLRQGVVILADMAKFYGGNRIKSLEDRCHFSYVQPTSREAIISQLRKLASERQYEAMMFFPGFWDFLPWDQDFFGPFGADLKLITGTGAGYDHINIDYLNQIGACYANSPVAVAEPTAMAAVMLILQTVRATTQAEMTLRRGKWREGIELTDDIRDMTIGIIGNGRIGQLVQKKMQALGAGKILYNNRNRLPHSDENGAIYKPLDELLSQSDLITLHCPYTPETKHLISDEQFAKMKKGSYVVNTSRGAVIDEKALVRAMESEKIVGVGLDVFENEPEVHPYLMKSERATLLPHCGSSVKRAIHDVHIESINNLEKWLDTGVPNTPVNKPFPKLKN